MKISQFFKKFIGENKIPILITEKNNSDCSNRNA